MYCLQSLCLMFIAESAKAGLSTSKIFESCVLLQSHNSTIQTCKYSHLVDIVLNIFAFCC